MINITCLHLSLNYCLSEADLYPMRNFFKFPPVVCFGQVKEFLFTLSITEQLDILSHNLENISGRTCESCVFFHSIHSPHFHLWSSFFSGYNLIPDYHFSHSQVIISLFFCFVFLKDWFTLAQEKVRLSWIRSCRSACVQAPSRA